MPLIEILCENDRETSDSSTEQCYGIYTFDVTCERLGRDTKVWSAILLDDSVELRCNCATSSAMLDRLANDAIAQAQDS